MKKRIKRALLPHVDNDHLPELLQRSALLGMTLLVLLSFMMSNVQALLWQSSDWLIGAVLPAVVVERTNKERTTEHLGILTRNDVLDAAAQLKANDMAAKGYFAHYSPAGVAPWHWFDEVGYSYVNAGENLAVHFTDSSQVVTAWMNSPTHRANIVNPNYTEIGVGTARGTYEGFSTVFVVQLFGTPAATGSDITIAPVVPTLATVASAEPDAPDLVPIVVEKQAVAGIETVRADEANELAVAIDEAAPAPAAPVAVPPTTIERTEIDDETNTTSLYTGMIATTTDKQPAEAVLQATPETHAGVAALATQPSRVLQIVYVTIGTAVAFALLSSLIVAWQHHRPRQILYGVLLLLLMSVLFYVHLLLTTGAVVV